MLPVRSAFSRFMASDGLFLSAGLAFFFLVTLIPVTLIGVSIMGFALSSHEAASEVVGQLTRNFPVYEREIKATLLRIIDTRAASGALGTVILVLFATPLFSSSRLVLHRLLGSRIATGYITNMLVDTGMVFVLGGLVLCATAVTWGFQWTPAFVLRPAGLSRQWLRRLNTSLRRHVFGVVV